MRAVGFRAASLLGALVRSRRAAVKTTLLADLVDPLEEETLPQYRPSDYLQIDPGDVLDNGRYSIISKLGYGGASTVWLAKDLTKWRWQANKYVTLKVNTCNLTRESIEWEHSLHKRLCPEGSRHPGYGLVNRPIDTFEIQSEGETHFCLVHEAFRETLGDFRYRFKGGTLPTSVLRAITRGLLGGLDFLHTDCKIIHTDLKLNNILTTFEDEDVLSDKAEEFLNSENHFKQSADRRIYRSIDDFGPMKSLASYPIITDFETALDRDSGIAPIQPHAYRAPEVLLGWGWSKSVDIWNLAHLIWLLASGKDLFSRIYSFQRSYCPRIHLAQMIRLLGAPPSELIKRKPLLKWKPALRNWHNGELCTDACAFFGGPFFDHDSGEFLYPEVLQDVRVESLDDRANFIADDDRTKFVDFMRNMLTWDPDKRASANDLFDHPWLYFEGKGSLRDIVD